MFDDSIDFKDRIEQILSDSGYSENRAAKMDVDDLLKLLAAFNVLGM